MIPRRLRRYIRRALQTAGLFYLSLIASNAPCADDTDVVVLSISPSPVAGITSSSSGSVCAALPIRWLHREQEPTCGSRDPLPPTRSLPRRQIRPCTRWLSPTALHCTVRATYTLNVIPAGIPTAGSDQWICAGDSALLTGTVQNATGMQWITYGDGTLCT
jgi:hypothetical protein